MKQFNQFLVLMSIVIFPFIATAKQLECYFQGKDDVNIRSSIQDFLRKKPLPGTWSSDGFSRNDHLIVIINENCNVGEVNSVIKKFSMCLGFSMKDSSVITLDLSKQQSDKEITETLAKLKKERCIKVATQTHKKGPNTSPRTHKPWGFELPKKPGQ